METDHSSIAEMPLQLKIAGLVGCGFWNFMIGYDPRLIKSVWLQRLSYVRRSHSHLTWTYG